MGPGRRRPPPPKRIWAGAIRRHSSAENGGGCASESRAWIHSQKQKNEDDAVITSSSIDRAIRGVRGGARPPDQRPGAPGVPCLLKNKAAAPLAGYCRLAPPLRKSWDGISRFIVEVQWQSAGNFSR